MNTSAQARASMLIQRARCIHAIRSFFYDAGVIEINAPVMVHTPGLELHLDAFEVSTDRGPRYLHTSPEYALKKVLALGLERIYSLTPCFRDEPCSATHAPEFTMLEWYMAGFTLTELMDQTEALIRYTWSALGRPRLTSRGHTLDLGQPFERLSVRDAFTIHAGIDPWAYETGRALRDRACELGLRISSMVGPWDDVFFELFLNEVEPHLGHVRPVFLWGWPASQAALARLDPHDETRALRFELFAGGLELANAFDELIDPVEQRRRFEDEQAQRRALSRPIYEIDQALLDALHLLGPTCGIALGLDRLIMLLVGATSIEEVMVPA
ncbi:MAG: EF-P lysine aminoacylase EpmA [Myxococcota bacterium]|nr:EF-P lysine aminoacylase EpmA [Myxococcota bacterium]